MPEETQPPATQTATPAPSARAVVGERERAQILLEVTAAVVSNLNLSDLLRAVSACLKRFFNHDFASLVLYEEEAGRLRVHALDAPTPGGVLGEGSLLPLDGTPPGLAIRTRETVLRERVDIAEFDAPEVRAAYAAGLRSGCSVPLISRDRVLGTLNVASLREAAFTVGDAGLLRQIADPVAVAVENVLNYERAARESARSRTLLEVNNAVATHLDLHDLLRATSACLRAYFRQDFAGLALYDEATRQLRVHALDLTRPDTYLYEGEPLSLDTTLNGICFTTRRPVVRGRIDEEETSWPIARTFYQQQGLKSFCCVPLVTRERAIGVLSLGSRQEGAMPDADVEMFQRIADQVAIAVENSLNYKRAKYERDRFELLLEINNAIVSQLNLSDLTRAVSAALQGLVKHDFMGISVYDAEQDCLRPYAYTGELEERLSFVKAGLPMPLGDTPSGLVFSSGRPLLVDSFDSAKFSPALVERMRQQNIKSGCGVPLVAHGRKIGVVAVASFRESAFTEADLELLGGIAGQIALAVENALNFERATRERERAETLLEVNNAITTILDLRELLRATSDCLRRYFKHDLAGMALYDAESGQLRVHSLDWVDPTARYIEEGVLMPLDATPAGLAFTSRRPVLVKRLEEWPTPSHILQRALAAGLRSSCNAPLVTHDRALGSVAIVSRREAGFTEADAEMLGHIARQFAIAVENALQFGEIEGLKNKLASEKLYLEEEIRAEYNFGEIVGQSRALKSVLEQLKTVAPTDSVVLICGETGTGKELIARAIHDLSARRERTMVKVNCAAIPTGLLESEFFGHERGAFTGAVTQRAGRFELANKGTLFLDEVGEIPLELQPKLLRVLQEHEFERLGGTRTIKVDVRLIAATNCNLREMVSEKKFRSDLFYRLNVFPVLLPPLRERADDIPLLAGYFAQKHSRRMNKRIDSIPSETVEALCRYRWPGNVRELENFIERAVILTRGRSLQAPLSELELPGPAGGDAVNATEPPAGLLSLADAERAHIESVLRHTKGVVGGRGGAAEILGLPISTLRGRMKKLGLM